ncbi:citrate synthase [Actinoplanes sp. NPDC051851]|uniref:citrate synthase n=1 Tax=Actinoplanes sp. NPDC051851 TaxID=3154753 RepID=UPI003435147C
MTLLTTAEVAARLGVKPATVYAYVSRGLLASRRNADGKGSLFAKQDVDELIASRKRTTPAIRTGLTLIRDGALFYRGHDVSGLAATATFEAVATLLWTGELRHQPFETNPVLRATADRVVAVLPPGTRLVDRLRVVVAAVAAADPLRFDTSPAAVQATGRTLIAIMAGSGSGSGSGAGAGAGPGVSVARSLWPALAPEPGGAAGVRALEAALILLADHDLAASTLAARVAASTRAHPYAVVSAGLAALDGPLHGAASEQAYPLLAEVMSGADPLVVISERLRAGTVTPGFPVPGFGHDLYPDGDPRGTALLALLDGPAVDAASALAAAVASRSGALPTIDLALAALALRYGMPAGAGEAIFAVARTVGWLAHALEEYTDRPSRFRPTGHYAGRQP